MDINMFYKLKFKILIKERYTLLQHILLPFPY